MSEEEQNDGSKKTALLSLDLPQGAECVHVEASTNISQTPTGQLTACSVQPADVTGKWNCEVCTYENFAMSKKCTMCRSSKPLLGEDIFLLQDGGGARALPPAPPPSPPLPTPNDSELDVCELSGVASRLRPLRIASPAPEPERARLAKWACATCTYENWPKSQKCAMCGHGNPAAAGAHAVDCKRTSNTGVNEGVNSPPSQERHEERRRRNNADWVWLQACLGVVEGDMSRVAAYLAAGGDAARALTPAEAARLDRPSAFDAGHTLVHLAIRFQRQDILSNLLSRISGGGPGLKRSPSYIAPDLAAAIRRHVAGALRGRKAGLQCRYINEFCSFSLPSEIEDLPAAIQEQLFSELLDQDAQRCLEADPKLNWSLELSVTLGSRLYALWNRSAGDCLPDGVLQAAYGVFDRQGLLRAAAADLLRAAPRPLYERWAATERRRAGVLYAPEDSQLRAEWAGLVAAAARPRAALHQVHVWALSHVMRRPILVYGVDVVRSFRGEPLGHAGFHGIYLPLLWEPEFCSKSPLCLGYTRGHFSALVPIEPYCRAPDYISRELDDENEEVIYLPLTDADGKLLPVHFLTCDEMSQTETVLRRWLSPRLTAGGVLAARRACRPRPLLVAQMLEEWLNHYRRLAQQTRGPFPPRLQTAEFSSDPDTDEE